jgi:hypothetical protein
MANETSKRESGPSIPWTIESRALLIILTVCLLTSLLPAQAIIPVSGRAIHTADKAAARLKVPCLQSSVFSSDMQLNFKSFLVADERRTNSFAFRAAIYRFSRNSTALATALASTAQPSNGRNWLGDVTNHSFKFEPSYGIAPHTAAGSTQNVEQYVRYIPAAGPLIVRICERTKAHPHVTRALSMFHPDL